MGQLRYILLGGHVVVAGIGNALENGFLSRERDEKSLWKRYRNEKGNRLNGGLLTGSLLRNFSLWRQELIVLEELAPETNASWHFSLLRP